MRREDTGYSHYFGVNSEVFKDNDSETEAKTNSGHRVRPLSVRGPLFTC